MKALAFLATHALKLEEATYRVNRDVGDGRVWTRADGKWPGAGPRRNIRMLEAERPDLVLAYPNAKSRGTWQCVKEALSRGIFAIVWAPTISLATIDRNSYGGKSLDGKRFLILPPNLTSGHIVIRDRGRQILEALGGES